MIRKRGIVRELSAIVLATTMLLMACSTNWVEEAEQIVAAMIPAAANLVTLVATLEGKTVTAEDLAMIQSAGTQAGADLQLISSLIAAYQKADDAAKPAILNQVESAIHAVQSNLSGLLGALHIKDAATQAKITAVVGILLSEVQSLAAVLPIVQGSAGAGAAQAKARAGQLPHPAANIATRVGHPQVPLSAREFVKSYNSTLSAKTGNAELDRVAVGLQIHQHGKLARWASAGVLQ